MRRGSSFGACRTRRFGPAWKLELEDARVPLKEAVDSAHMFVFDQMQERLTLTRKRADMLMERLANAVPLSGKQVQP